MPMSGRWLVVEADLGAVGPEGVVPGAEMSDELVRARGGMAASSRCTVRVSDRFSTPRCGSGRGGIVEKGDAPEERIFKFCLVGPGELGCVSAQEDQAVQGDPERGSGEEGVFRA